jgi:hypothetical protein
MIMGFLTDIITGPYAGIMIIAAGMAIAIFAGFSKSKKVNISIAVITALAFTGGIYIYIMNWVSGSLVPASLVTTGLPETILSAAILFAGLNILLLRSLDVISRRSFVRETMLLAFSVISLLLLIMANDLIMFTVSLTVAILSIFNLLASSLKNNGPAREYIGKFGIRLAVPAAFILFGLSLLAGTGKLGNISSYAGFSDTGEGLFMASVIILGAAAFLYSSLYPFQGAMLRLCRRADSSSAAILWFLYIPSVIVLLIKLEAFFSNYFARESIYGFVVLAVLAFLNLFGAGIGSIKAMDLKRILTMLILFQLGTVLLIRAAGFTGSNLSYAAGIFDFLVLSIIFLVFLPLSIFLIILDKNGRGTSMAEARGIFRLYPYAGACFIIISLWWLAANIYIFYLQGPLPGAIILKQGVEAAILYIGYVAALILMAVNLARIIIILFGKASGSKKQGSASFPILLYIYISIFTLVIIAITVLLIIGKAGISQGGIEVWGNIFYIFGNGN